MLVFTLNSCFLFENSGGKVDPIPTKEAIPTFIDTPTLFETDISKLDESSGIVPTKGINNGLWVQEDGGNPLGLHLIGQDGVYKKFYPMTGTNRDCEDIAIGPGPESGKNYVYLADIGDNNALYNEYYIHRFIEPTLSETFIASYETITFTYSDGKSYNSEALLLDPLTKDLYIITKDQFNVLVFKLPYPQATSTPSIAQYLGIIPLFQITAGDISAKGNEILLKNYFAVYYWKLKANETIFQALSRGRDVGPAYIREDQGEGICFDNDANGFYCLGERAEKPYAPKLYYYMKK